MHQLPNMQPSILSEIYLFCPRCRVHIHVENIHTQEECEHLQEHLCPEEDFLHHKKKSLDVPQMVRDAFINENLDL